jgi:hypothetical protein
MEPLSLDVGLQTPVFWFSIPGTKKGQMRFVICVKTHEITKFKFYIYKAVEICEIKLVEHISRKKVTQNAGRETPR